MALPVRLAARVGRLETIGPESPQWSTSTPLRAREHARSALQRGETHYTDRPGIAPLREALARWLYSLTGRPFTRSEILVTCGATEARFVAVQCLLPPGGDLHILGPDPAIIEGAAIVRGCNVRPLAAIGTVTADDTVYVDARVPDLGPVVATLARQRSHVIYDISLVGEPALRQLADSLSDRTVIVGDVCPQGGMFGWRVGFLATQGVEFDAIRDFKQALTICTTNLSQWAALACVQGEP